MHVIELPLEVWYRNGKSKKAKLKKFILNLNKYGNTHAQERGHVKTAYKNLIWHTLPNIQIKYPVKLIYTYYRKNNTKVDIANVCSIIDKFACDVLVEKNILEDDNYLYVKAVEYVFGGVDKTNPRCELIIKKYD